ncbi:unnamed protein product [Protopolystoma xenopodis]|uniref:Uncharacterized protein n=1 Tax=Protopolystoma xenopodis TaxID=117903 RepID=A0A3S5APE5_9PLAT|nr:unnamed protein product [Protopolystoma xenopodis]
MFTHFRCPHRHRSTLSQTGRRGQPRQTEPAQQQYAQANCVCVRVRVHLCVIMSALRHGLSEAILPDEHCFSSFQTRNQFYPPFRASNTRLCVERVK